MMYGETFYRPCLDGQVFYYVKVINGIYDIEVKGYTQDGFDAFIYRDDCMLGSGAANNPFNALNDAMSDFEYECGINKHIRTTYKKAREQLEYLESIA